MRRLEVGMKVRWVNDPDRTGVVTGAERMMGGQLVTFIDGLAAGRSCVEPIPKPPRKPIPQMVFSDGAQGPARTRR